MSNAGIAASAAIANVPTDWQLVGVADADGDGRDDLFWRNSVTGGNAVWLMNGRSVKGTRTLLNVSDQNWRVAALADVNGDGRPDLVWRNSAAGQWAVWLLDDTGVVQTRVWGGIPSEWEIRAAGDFNGDGRADVIWRRSTDGAVAIFRMDGVNTLGVNFLAGGLLDWDIVASADFARSGVPQILFRNQAGSAFAWVTLNSTATAISSTLFRNTPGASWSVTTVGDYDGDTHPDILFRNAAGEVVIWRLENLVLPGNNSVEQFRNVKFLGNPGNIWEVIPR
jgi:FG-GAP-like repeat/FG-GAP repeat